MLHETCMSYACHLLLLVRVQNRSCPQITVIVHYGHKQLENSMSAGLFNFGVKWTFIKHSYADWYRGAQMKNTEPGFGGGVEDVPYAPYASLWIRLWNL